MSLTAGLFAFVATVLFMFVLRPVASEIGLVDVPFGRKRHGVEVPVIGGIAMSTAIGLASAFSPQPEYFVPTILAIYLLVAVGTIDDKYDLPPGVRLVAQAIAAVLVVFGAGFEVETLGRAFLVNVDLGPFAGIFSLLFFVTLINAFNVVDGIDGLAGGLSLLSLVSLAAVGYGGEVFGLAAVCASAVAGFLLFNLPVGRVHREQRSFMGDAGSTFLGLTIAAIGISVTQDPVSGITPVVGLWLVAVPVYDLFSAAIRRLLQGRSPFSPDHEHLHHALMLEGLCARSTLTFMLLFAVLLAGIGLAGHHYGMDDSLMLVGWLGGLLLYYQAMRKPARVVGALRSLKQLSAGARSVLRRVRVRV